MELAAEACKSLAIVGSATFAMAPSRTAIEIPIIMVAIAPYRCGKGKPSEGFFSMGNETLRVILFSG
ncbi:hypothetical protein D3C86_1424080 [compost metagenome]